MRYEREQLEVPTAATGQGRAHLVEELLDKWIQVEGTFSATVVLEGRIGTAWRTIKSVTAGDLFEVPQSVREVRVNVTAYTSGQAVVTLAGRNARSD